MRYQQIVFVMTAVITASPIHAQEYPNRVVRLIVPYLPGGSTDIVARILAARMPDSLMQQVIVDNRGGGASITGTEAVVRAQPAPIIERLRNELVKAQQ